jgi:hypothetical protein
MMAAGIKAEHAAKYPDAAIVNIRAKIAEEGCYAARRDLLLEGAGVKEGLSFIQQMAIMCPNSPRKRRGSSPFSLIRE